RANWDLFTEPASRAAVEWAERYADGNAERNDESIRLDWASEGAAFKKGRQSQSDRTDDRVETLADTYFHHVRLPRSEPRIDNDRLRRHSSAAEFANHFMFDQFVPYDPSIAAYAEVLVLPIIRDV